MKWVSKIIWGIVFIIIFVVALKNMDKNASLAFFSNYEIHGPLPLVLLAFTIAGFILGVLAMTPTVFRNRRALTKERKAHKVLQQENETKELARSQPPSPDTIVGF